MDEVTELLKYNTLEIRDDVIEMVAGEEIDITIDEEFRVGQGIPNKELMKEFEKALKDESFGYVAKIVEKSKNI